MIFLAVLLLLVAGPAAAHGTLPGGGGFYAGMAHPLLALEHLLVLLAGGLVLGRDGGRGALLALVAGLAAGLWYGFAGGWVQGFLLAVTLGLGAVLALQLRLPGWAMVAVLGAVGLAVGVETDVPEVNAMAGVLGVTVGIFLIVLNAMALGSVLRAPWAAVALRVAGAWMLAVALMVLAVQFRGLA